MFEYMYTTFQYAILAMLVLFGSFAFATTFFKGFKDYPFADNFSNYYKDIGETTRLVMLASVIAVIPPKTLFDFTVGPIIDLTMAVSYEILSTGNELDKCDAKTVVSEINDQKLARQEGGSFSNMKVLPPIVKVAQAKAMKDIEDSYVLSKDTVGKIICFMSNIVRSNAKEKMMGEVLMRSVFNFKTNNKIATFIYGFAILGLFTFINLLMSFYILDGFIQILKIAILWPFMVFGYAFKWIKFDIRDIVNTAKDFGFTMVALAVFTIFNTIMVHSFYFVNGGDTLLGILDKAKRLNDASVIIEAIPGDILTMSKFLFIIFAMFYVYSKLSEFTKNYSDGNLGDKPIGDGIKKLVESGIGVVTGVKRDEKPSFVKKQQEQNPSKPGKKEEKTETATEETSEVKSE
jgi:hypothetical protein